MILDISPPIHENLAVWPGDTPPSRQVLLDLDRGDSVTLSTLRATVHLGSHADAPSHYGRDAPTIETRDLSLYIGLCQVVDVPIGRGESSASSTFASRSWPPRLLLRTGTYSDPNRFTEDFGALSAEFVDHCSEHGVRLIGIDTPSVDPFSSKDLPAHQAFLRHDMAILEGLVLADVAPGLYELIALPLRLVGFDASPVRAILRSLDRAEDRP